MILQVQPGKKEKSKEKHLPGIQEFRCDFTSMALAILWLPYTLRKYVKNWTEKNLFDVILLMNQTSGEKTTWDL